MGVRIVSCKMAFHICRQYPHLAIIEGTVDFTPFYMKRIPLIHRRFVLSAHLRWY